MTAKLPGPFEFNHLASHFDRFLPQIHPVSIALLDHLPELAAGETVLDVACGTGEPGLTLARRKPNVQLVGVDQAEALVQVALGKVKQEALANARFSLMPMDALTLADASVDALISRFGLLMFGDIPASAREAKRVLRVGGAFSLAVWDDPTENTLMNALVTILRAHLPPDRGTPMDTLREWAEPGRRPKLLEDLGLRPVHTDMFRWEYHFASFDDAWDMVSGMGKFTGQSDLTPDAQEQVRQQLQAALETYRQPQGQYDIPHACRLLWGRLAS